MASPKSQRNQTLESMQRNKRMARTLGCLVASMTLGALLLDWVQPKRLPAATTGTQLIGIVPQGRQASWRSIQLDPLAPGTKAAPSHFIISRDGRAFPTNRWENQEDLGSEGTVRIALLASENSNQITSQQWTKASNLVRALQQACDISNEQVHYDMLAVPAVPEPRPGKPASPPRSSLK